MNYRSRLFSIVPAIVFVLTALPAFDSHAQGVPADPGLPGPDATEQFNFTLQGLGATVFYPGAGGTATADGPFSGLVLGHGFARARAQHANNGIFLASHGFIVVTVDFPNPLSPDFDAWAAQISAALDWLEAENADPASRFYQQIAVDRAVSCSHVLNPWGVPAQGDQIRSAAMAHSGHRQPDDLARQQRGPALKARLALVCGLSRFFGGLGDVFCYVNGGHGGLLLMDRK
jgi:hypothetical protein